nr:hypothetical protein [Pandoravirus aubagnensis]
MRPAVKHTNCAVRRVHLGVCPGSLFSFSFAEKESTLVEKKKKRRDPQSNIFGLPMGAIRCNGSHKIVGGGGKKIKERSRARIKGRGPRSARTRDFACRIARIGRIAPVSFFFFASILVISLSLF